MPTSMVRGILVAVGLGIHSLASAANFTTQRFDVQLQIRPDGDLVVTEDIAVTFTIPQHGLRRKLPQITASPTTRRHVDYSSVAVKANDGSGWKAEPVSAAPDGGDYVVRIGSASKFYRGPVRYRLSYRVSGAMTPHTSPPLGARSEFYWNLFPTGWATDIPAGSAKVLFPPLKKGPLQARIVGGPVGSRGESRLQVGNVFRSPNQYRATLKRSGVEVKLDAPLLVDNTVTLAVSLPGKTVVTTAPQIQRAPRTTYSAPAYPNYPSYPSSPGMSYSNGPEALPFDNSYGGSPLSNSPVLQFSISAFLLPILVAIGAVLAKRAGKEKPAVVVQFDPPAGLSPAECGYLHDMRFEARDIVAGMLGLAQKGMARIESPSTKRGFTLTLQDNRAAAGRLNRFENHLFGTLRMFGPWITPETLNGKFEVAYDSLRSALSRELSDQGLLQAPKGGGCAPALGGILLVLAVTAVSFFSLGLLALPGGFFGFIIVAVSTSTPTLLSPKGEEVRNHLEGFREFIARANADEMRKLADREPLQALYERLMPYAMAFGLMREWSRAFDGLDLQTPDWYVTDSADAWNTVQFMTLLDAGTNDWRRSMTPPPTAASTSSDSDWMSRSSSSFHTGSDFSSGGSSFTSSSDSGGGGSISSGGGGGGGGGDSW